MWGLVGIVHYQHVYGGEAMARGTRPGGSGHTITTFTPDDTEDTIYLSEYSSFLDIYNKTNEKWPGIQLTEVTLHAEHIHTDCLGYDKYDPMDYTNYIVITADSSYFKRIKGEGKE